MSRLGFIKGELDALSRRGLRRRMRTVEGAQDAVLRVDGREVVNFSSNNYLGLANHPVVREAAASASTLGAGSGASRLIVGNLEAHRALEAELAQFFECPAALLFNSGYQANVGVIQALAGRGDVVFSDELNHASLIDGCRLSRADVVVYPHGDVVALAELLASTPGRRRFIVTDSVFSMDGDRAPLAELSALADDFDAALIVDEAHAVGALGPGGRGVVAETGARADVVVGTLGKAFGGFGAFVLSDVDTVELLVNRARSFVFTTALPPAVVAGNTAALGLIRGSEGDLLRTRLERNISQLRDILGMSPTHRSPIFPVVVGDEARAMGLSDALLEQGLFAQGIRPPTVPAGTARLRIALMATHTEEQIAALGAAISEARREA